MPITAAGLSTEEALVRLRQTGPNSIRQEPRRGIALRIGMQLRDPMILLLLAAAAIAIALQHFSDTTVIGVVIVLNTAIGVAQELKAEQAIAALRQLAAPTARVIRDGHDVVIAAERIVPGDLVQLQAGDIVPADGVLIESHAMLANESALTGESVPVEKADGDLVSAGTVVTAGRGVFETTKTGANSALGEIAAMVAKEGPRATPLQRRLRGLSQTLAVTALGLSAIVLLIGIIQKRDLGEMAVVAISLSVAAVPESLPAVITLSLALGARRMARRSAIVRWLPAVETLGSVTVLATDKTGTLTQNRMLAERVWLPDAELEISGEGYSPVGSFRVRGSADSSPTIRLPLLLRDVLLCNDAALLPPAESKGEWAAAGDPLEGALLALAAKANLDIEATRDRHPRVSEIPFDASRRRMTTMHHDPDGGLLLVCKGAPDVLVELDPTLTAEEARAALQAAEAMAADGYRVIAVADRAAPPSASGTPLAELEGGVTLRGLVGIADPPRAGVHRVVQSLRQAGVRPVVVTGDHPVTARAIADRVGITDVYARTKPEQKLDIIGSLQDDGEIVAMTGDGVNDAPALRRADIGIAMGKGGTEVARQAADLVLADDELHTLVAAIEEGRRIYTNVRTFLRFALAGGFAEVIVMLVGPLTGLAIPLLPAQILWINMLTHGLPGVAFGAEPPDPAAMHKPSRSPDQSVLGDGLARGIVTTGLLMGAISLAVGWWAADSGRPAQTLVFITLGLAQLGVAAALRTSPGRRGGIRFLDLAIAGSAILLALGVFASPLHTLLETTTPKPSELLVAVVAAVVPGSLIAVQRGLKSRRDGDVTKVHDLGT